MSLVLVSYVESDLPEGQTLVAWHAGRDALRRGQAREARRLRRARRRVLGARVLGWVPRRR